VLSLIALCLILGVFTDSEKHKGGHHGGEYHHGQEQGNHAPKPEDGPTHPVDQTEVSNTTVSGSIELAEAPVPHPPAHPMCSWKGPKDTVYNIGKILGKTDVDLSYYNGDISVYVRPCGPVMNSFCPNDSSICVITNTKDGVSFGTYQQKQFAEAANKSLEVTYGGGEPCPNGVPRKSIVTYSCTKLSTRIVSAEFDEDQCFAQIHIELSHKDCMITSGKNCTGYPDKHHRSNLFTVLMFSAMALLMSFFICFALCACRRSKRLRAARLNAAKKSGKIPSIPYEAIPIQLVPGGFSPVDPYTLQGYPMISLVAPTQAPVKGESV